MQFVVSCFVDSLAAGQTLATAIGIDFKDTMQPAKFDLWCVYCSC